jgi:hypothetical protein
LAGSLLWSIVVIAFIGDEPKLIAVDFDDFFKKVGRVIE